MLDTGNHQTDKDDDMVSELYRETGWLGILDECFVECETDQDNDNFQKTK